MDPIQAYEFICNCPGDNRTMKLQLIKMIVEMYSFEKFISFCRDKDLYPCIGTKYMFQGVYEPSIFIFVDDIAYRVRTLKMYATNKHFTEAWEIIQNKHHNLPLHHNMTLGQHISTVDRVFPLEKEVTTETRHPTHYSDAGKIEPLPVDIQLEQKAIDNLLKAK